MKRIYGIVGDSLNGITDSLRRQGRIEWVHVRHEEAAAFAAAGEAHLTGALAVRAGSCGPDNLHLINGLFDAHRSRVPVLAIAAQIPSAAIDSGYFQEMHPQDLFRECSHFCELVCTAKPDAADARGCHSRCGVETRRRGDSHPRRCRPSAGIGRLVAECGGPAAGAAVINGSMG